MRGLGFMNNATTGGNDPRTADDAGNGYLLEQGYTIVGRLGRDRRRRAMAD